MIKHTIELASDYFAVLDKIIGSGKEIKLGLSSGNFKIEKGCVGKIVEYGHLKTTRK